MSEERQQGVPAVGFLVVAFLDENAADQALDAMKEAKKQEQFYFEDAAVIRQDADGKVHYHETGDMGTGKGAGIGALVGGVLGILGGPAGMVLGAGAGAAAGAAIAQIDSGFKNANLKTLGVALKPGTSALVAITSHDFLKAMQKEVPAEQIAGSVRNLATHIAERLGENKNVAIGLLLTEGGLGVKEIAVNEESAEVVGAVLTSEGALVGAAAATAGGVAYQVAAAATGEGTASETGVLTPEGAVVVDAVEAVAAAPAENAAAPAEKAEAAAAAAPEAKAEEKAAPEASGPATESAPAA